MKKNLVYVLLVAVLLLAACAPAATSTQAPAEPTQVSVAEPTQPSTTGATGTGAYTLPEGALIQPVPLAAGAQFAGKIAYTAGKKARIAYMPPVINPYYGAIEQGAKAKADALGVEMVTFSPSGDSDIAGQMKQPDVPLEAALTRHLQVDGCSLKQRGCGGMIVVCSFRC